MKNKLEKINYSFLFLFVTLIMSFPSIVYLIRNKTVLNFQEWFTFFLKIPASYLETFTGAMCFGIILILLFYYYFKIIKNSNKEFKTIKSIIIYVLIISCIFGIMLPFTTSDIFYYIGTGWIDSNYGENPYYTSVYDVRLENPNDQILQRTGVWEKQIVVYGPLWAFTCKILSFLSFGNVTASLYIFKLASIIIHILNTILVFKITNKNKFAILYGLNPFILFEMITNVHNDIYLIFFILISLYFLLKKKNIVLTIIFMALATCIKYVSVLLIPFLVLYYLRDKKIQKKIFNCVIYAVLFVFVIALIYLLYADDISVILTMMMQQGKYRESILAIMLDVSSKIGIDILRYAKAIFIIIFLFAFIDGLTYMFIYKKINLRNTIKKYNKLLVVFLFFIITNLCPWYTSWFIPTMFWLKGKYIKNILYLQFSYELVTLINFALFSESYEIGLVYLPIMMCLICCFNNIDKVLNKKRIKKIQIEA